MDKDSSNPVPRTRTMVQARKVLLILTWSKLLCPQLVTITPICNNVCPNL